MLFHTLPFKKSKGFTEMEEPQLKTCWEEFSLWRFNPQEERARGIIATNSDLLAKYFFEQGSFDQAVRYFGLAQVLGMTHRALQMGYLFQLKGELPKAKEYYEQALMRGVKDESLYSNLGALETAQGRLERAESILNQGLKIHPTSVSLLFNLSTLCWKKRDWEEVVTLLQKVLILDPHHAEALRLLEAARKNLHLEKISRHLEGIKGDPFV